MADDIGKVEAEAMLKDSTKDAEVVVLDAKPKFRLLSRDAILNAIDLKHEDVEVEEWGGIVRVRGLKGTERDEFEASIVIQDGDGKSHVESRQMRARLCSKTIIDESGVRLFTEMDVGALGNKSAAALERVFDIAMRLAGMSKDEVEKLSKNSETTPVEGSDSDSL